ncbi:hypothetical protein AB6A40_008326 [Gnathostoma spinigerum]|uniref:Cyclin-like domain-containing protein n=1 Tax=Gnathostoma spinigerum TaxID=75299 RepID=A0ABD6EY47_9BILA
MSAIDKRKIFVFVIETGIKLEANNVTICSAVVLTHRVLRKSVSEGLCPYTAASACILLAAKVEEDSSVRIRDVLNIAYSVLHPDDPMLEIGEKLWAMRNGLARMEYIVLRILRFKLKVDNPHNYLALYLSSLGHWMPREFKENHVGVTAFILLRDIHVSPRWVLSHSPQTVALVCLAVALRITRVSINVEWQRVFNESLSSSRMRSLEAELLRHISGDS